MNIRPGKGRLELHPSKLPGNNHAGINGNDLQRMAEILNSLVNSTDSINP